jgi:hypothetical protein
MRSLHPNFAICEYLAARQNLALLEQSPQLWWMKKQRLLGAGNGLFRKAMLGTRKMPCRVASLWT